MGLSYNFSSKKAVEKAVLELWQIFILLHYSIISGYDGSKNDDIYHRHFWLNNNINSFNLMTDNILLGRISLNDYLVQKSSDKKAVESHMKNITSKFYFYLAKESIGAQIVWFVRLMSPGFFIHMNCANALNHENLISAEFPHVFEDRRNRLVLFP